MAVPHPDLSSRTQWTERQQSRTTVQEFSSSLYMSVPVL